MTTTKRPYADGTDVPVARSLDEIKTELAKRGVTTFGYAQDGAAGGPVRVVVAFKNIVEPDPQDYPGYRAGNGRWVDGEKQRAQETRRRWRTLALYIKAALVAVDEQLMTAPQVLQAFALLPDGRTAGDWLEPQLKHAYATGQMPVIAAQHKGEKETLDERFARWIEANPQVLDVFIERAEQYRSQGRRKIGAKRIVEDMRWDERLYVNGDPFKINNVFVSRLARLAVAQRPHLAGFFEFRELQS